MVRLNDRPNMTSAVYRGRKTTTLQQRLPYGSGEEGDGGWGWAQHSYMYIVTAHVM